METPLSVLQKLNYYFYRRGVEIAKEFFPPRPAHPDASHASVYGAKG
jgi:hypothetical protein